MDKLDINLFKPEYVNKEKYEKEKLDYISSKQEYIPGSFLSIGYYKKRPDVGEIEWKKMYPQGYASWASNQRSLNAYGQQNIIDKLNEVVEFINTLPALLPNEGSMKSDSVDKP